MKRFIVTEDEKRSIRQMYLLEGGDDPISTTSNVSAPVLKPEQQNILKSNLWNHIEKHDDLKHSLGLDDTHNEHNFLDTVSHLAHVHYDPSSKHLGFEFPTLGKKHNVSFDLGLSLQKHDNSNDHGHSQLSSLNPHSAFNVGVKIPIKNIFGK
jgi:hypothetical protein